MIQDIHSHTFYSKCGRDDPHQTIDAAIKGGIEVFGISDHNYGISSRKAEYKEMLDSLKKEYAGRIKLLCGIEISTLPEHFDVAEGEVSSYDYCLIENLGQEGSIIGDDVVSFIKGFDIPAGIAHTDIFGFCEKTGRDPYAFFAQLAVNGIFWEMNVSYDSIHSYREHEYVKAFFKSPEQQKIISDTGMRLSVGFDGHRVEDYLPERVKAACEKAEKLGIPLIEIEAK